MTNQVIRGDCMDVMREMPDNSIDTIITDPPYHLGSISKRFAKTSLGDDNDTAANARNGSNQYARLSTGFMGKSWDGGGIAFQPELWAEMLRVAKPGATLMAFGGDRTHHRLMVAIEDAGWEIRTCMYWMFGSGFPKSLNINKSIQKSSSDVLCVCEPHCQETTQDSQFDYRLLSHSDDEQPLSDQDNAQDDVPLQDGVLEHNHDDPGMDGRDLEPTNISSDEEISPLSIEDSFLQKGPPSGEFQFDDSIVSDIPLNRSHAFGRETHKTESHKFDKLDSDSDSVSFSSNIPLNDNVRYSHIPYCTTCGKLKQSTWEGFGTGLKPAAEIIVVAQKPIDGTYANNALVHGVAGLNIDGARIGTNGRPLIIPHNEKSISTYGDGLHGSHAAGITHQGRWPANVLMSHHENCVRRGEKRVRGHSGYPKGPGGNSEVYGYAASGDSENFREAAKEAYADPNGLETVADWECVEGCPIRILDEQAGVRRSYSNNPETSNNAQHRKVTGSGNSLHWKFKDKEFRPLYGDSGSASRFFYTAKAPNREKWFFCQLCQAAYPNKERDDHGHDIPQGQRKHIVAHPTVKPLSILNYLCKLTKTPTGGIVLDPFAGSGTTGLACLETGRDFILIEKESDYYQIAKARVKAAMSEPRQAELW